MSGRSLLRLTRMSSSQEKPRERALSRPTTIYKPLKQIEPLAISLGKTRDHWTLLKGHRTLNTCVRRSNVSRVSESNGNLQSTGRRVSFQRTRPVHTGPVRIELRKLAGSPDASHRTHPKRPVLTGLIRREGRQTACTPDAEHRTLSGASKWIS